MDWRTAYSRTTLAKPDTRTTQYTSNAGAPFQWDSGGQGRAALLSRRARAHDRLRRGPRGSYRTPWWKLQGHASRREPAYTYRERTSNLRRFMYRRGVNPPDFTLPPEQILDPANVSDGQIQFRRRAGRPTISMRARRLPDTTGWPTSRSSETRCASSAACASSTRASARSSTIPERSSGQGGEGPHQHRSAPEREPDPWTPLSDMNVRASWSQTVARPEFREPRKVLFPEPLGLRPTQSANSESCRDQHHQLRPPLGKWFFAPLELVSPASQRISYVRTRRSCGASPARRSPRSINSDARPADPLASGFEGPEEARLHRRQLSWRGSSSCRTVTWTDSAGKRGARDRGDEVRDADREVPSSASRLSRASNAILEYEPPRATASPVSSTTRSPRPSTTSGVSGLPDIFHTARLSSDFTWSKSFQIGNRELAAKFSVENILNDALPLLDAGQRRPAGVSHRRDLRRSHRWWRERYRSLTVL